MYGEDAIEGVGCESRLHGKGLEGRNADVDFGYGLWI
jgi:hypothetical protein